MKKQHEKVARAGIQRDPERIYYLDHRGHVVSKPMARRGRGVNGSTGRARMEAETAITRETGWLYFVDRQGDVSRVPMVRR